MPCRFMIQNKMSPDGFVQVCIQLAYYTMCVELLSGISNTHAHKAQIIKPFIDFRLTVAGTVARTTPTKAS